MQRTRQLKKNFFRWEARLLIRSSLCLNSLFFMTDPGALAQQVASIQDHPVGMRPGLEAKGRPLKEVLKEMESRFGIYFMFDSDQFKELLVVPARGASSKIEDLLEEMLKPVGLKYKKVGNIFVITDQSTGQLLKEIKQPSLPLDKDASASIQQALLERLDTKLLQQQEAMADISVSGKVTSNNGEGLPGVSVVVKGTTIGTATNNDGTYKLSIPDSYTNGTLIFSYIGFTSEEVAIGSRTTIDVSLIADIKSLSEVVVVGYGTQKKIELTGAVSSVQAKEVNALPVRSVAEALQGRVAGVEVSKGDGSPGDGNSKGGGTNILIRGAASLNGAAPLILVDGVRVGTGFDFNMRDVERIDILKDGSSAAIYGREAAGGVILVTTKRGSNKSDKINITANAYYGVREVVRHYDLLGTPDYITTRKVYLKDDPTFANPSALPNTNWYNELFRPAAEKNINISASGGNNKFSYFVSGSYLREDGVRIDNWSERFGLRLNTDLQISKRFKVGQSLFLRKSNNNPTQNSGIPFRAIPTMSAYDENGDFGKAPSYFQGGNPVGNELIHIDNNSGFGFNGNVFGEWEVVNGLTFKTVLAMNAGTKQESNFTAPYNYGNLSSNQQTYALKVEKEEDYQMNLLLTYKKQIEKHSFSLLGGYEARKSMNGYNVKAISNNALSNPTQTFNTDTTSRGYRIEGGLDNPFRYLSYFGRLTYNYAEKYFLTANLRRDGAYEFLPAQRFDVFPSVSGAWRISEEGFFQGVPIVSSLKLRAGYAVLGNDPLGDINPFAYKSFYTRTDNAYGAVSFGDGNRSVGWGVKGLANPDLRWELVKSTNIGLDLGLFQEKLTLTLDWYNRNTDRMIYTVTPPVSSGLSGQTVPINIGSMLNRGLEVAATYGNNLGDFTYNISANTSFNRNKLLSINNLDVTEIRSGSAGDTWYGSISNSKQGQPLAQFYGYEVEGIYKTDQQVKERGVKQDVNTGAGDLIYRDINGDKVIDDKDKTSIGNPWPNMTYGLSLNLGYKGFDLTLFFQGVQGASLYNGAKGYTSAVYSDYNTTAAIFGTSFFNGNGLTDQPRVGTTFTDNDGNKGFKDVNGNYKNISSYFVEDGSYLKLKNLQFGYTIPKSVTQRLKISNIRVYFQTQNLFTITKYSGLDPEMGWEIKGKDNNIQRGIDNYGTYPRTRLYSFGLDINF